MFKKLIASLSAVVMMSSFVAPSFTYGANFNRDDETAYNYLNGENSTNADLTKSADVSSFAGNLSREAFAALSVRWLNQVMADGGEITEQFTADECNFSDLNKADPDLKDEIVDSCRYGLMGIDSSTDMPADMFNPKDLVNRAQMETVISRMIRGATNNSTSSNYRENHRKALMDAGVITKDIDPKQSASRTQLGLMLNRVDLEETDAMTEVRVSLKETMGVSTSNTDDCAGLTPDDMEYDLLGCGSTETPTCADGEVYNTTTDMCEVSAEPTEVKAGSLEISMVPSTAKSPVPVPMNATVNFGSLNVVAGDKDVTVRSIILNRFGLGSRSEVSRVFFEKNGVRISSRNTLSNDGTVTLSFYPELVVKANATETIDVVAVLAAAGLNSYHRFEVLKSSDVDSTAQTINGSFPLATLEHVTTNYSVTPVNVDTTTVGTSGNMYRFGDKQVEVGAFRLTNNSTEERDTIVKGITLRSSNSSMVTNLNNFKVYKGGTELAGTTYSFNGKDLTLTLNDELKQGRTETYYIKADVVNVEQGDAGDAYTLSIKNKEDVNVIEKNSTFKGNITLNDDSAATSTNLQLFTIKGGDVTITRPASISSSENVTRGQYEAVLMVADVTVTQAVRLGDIVLAYNIVKADGTTAGSGADMLFRSFKLMKNNTQITSVNPGTGASDNVSFDTEFDLPKGTYTLKILADVKDNAPADQTFNFTTAFAGPVSSSSAIRFGEFTNSDTSGTPVVAGSSQGIRVTIKSSELTVASIGSDDTFVRGSKNQLLMKFSVTAGSTSDATITRIDLTGANVVGTTAFDSNNLTNLKLYEVIGSGIEARDTSRVDGTTVTFDGFVGGNIVVAKGKAKFFEVRGDFSTNVTPTHSLRMNVSNVIATDVNSRNYTINAVAGRLYTATDLGTLTVSPSSTSPVATLVLPSDYGTESNEIAQFTFAGQRDIIKLTDLILTNTATLGMTLQERVSSMGLYLGDEKIANGTVLGNQVRFNMSNSLVIPKNSQNTILKVKAGFSSSVQSGDYTSGNIQLAINTGMYYSGGTYVNAEAFPNMPQGIASGVRALSDSVGDAITGSYLTLNSYSTPVSKLVSAKPIIDVLTTTSSASNAYRFNVTAQGGRITISGLYFDFATTTAGNYNIMVNNTVYYAGLINNGSFTTLTNSIEVQQNETITISVTAQADSVVTNGMYTTAKLVDVEYVAEPGVGNYIVNGLDTYFTRPTMTYSLGI